MDNPKIAYIITQSQTFSLGTIPKLSELMDVELTNIVDGQTIVWDSTDNKFKNDFIE